MINYTNTTHNSVVALLINYTKTRHNSLEAKHCKKNTDKLTAQ